MKNVLMIFYSHFHADITADKQQVLYRSCMATDQDTLVRCNGVVVDILSEKGLCPLHLASDSEVHVEHSLRGHNMGRENLVGTSVRNH